jgi:sulfite exporter TauE/SafE
MLLLTAFLLGLIGSLAHCAGMCGPLAMALPVVGTSARSFTLGRAACNLGRICTYCLLGVVFGLVGKTALLAGIQRWVSIALGVVLLAGLIASRRLALSRPVMLLIERLKSRMSFLLRRRSFLSLAGLGLLNGLLPCGLVYVACAGAAAAGGVLGGAAYMAAFGAGTLPMMLGIGLSGRLVPLSFRLKLRRALPVSVFLLASLLILRGMALNIPFLSPDLSSDKPACCQK